MQQLFFKLYSKYRTIILYAIIGAACAGLDFCIYAALCWAGIKYLIANAVSVHCGIGSSFMLNRAYNFKVKDRAAVRLLSFYIVGLMGLAASSLLLYLLIDAADMHGIAAKIAALAAAAAMQFLLNTFVTFKKTKQDE
jgi:putative flippase GtrA